MPGIHNARNAAAALEAAALAGADEAAAAARARGLRAAPGGASSARAQRRRARSWSTTTPTTRPRSRRRSRPRARSGRGASSPSSSRTSTRARPHLAGAFGRALAAGRPRLRARRLPGARARRGLPRGQRAAGRRGGRRRGGGREVLWLPRFDDAERVLGARLRDGDLLLVLGAGDVARSASGSPPIRPENRRNRTVAAANGGWMSAHPAAGSRSVRRLASAACCGADPLRPACWSSSRCGRAARRRLALAARLRRSCASTRSTSRGASGERAPRRARGARGRGAGHDDAARRSRRAARRGRALPDRPRRRRPSPTSRTGCASA